MKASAADIPPIVPSVPSAPAQSAVPMNRWGERDEKPGEGAGDRSEDDRRRLRKATDEAAAGAAGPGDRRGRDGGESEGDGDPHGDAP